MNKYFSLFLLGIILLQSKEAASRREKYKVTRITEGDTVTIVDGDNKPSQIRLVCVDAPEMEQKPWGQKSLNLLKSFIRINQTIEVILSGPDQFGRMLGEFYNLRNENVNKKMLEHGLVVLYKFSLKDPACNDYHEIEKQAKLAKKNVWSDPSFISPLDFRTQSG